MHQLGLLLVSASAGQHLSYSQSGAPEWVMHLQVVLLAEKHTEGLLHA